ncbi:TPA: hypothetical protein ACNVNE_001539 [Klebsiella aerogenes]
MKPIIRNAAQVAGYVFTTVTAAHASVDQQTVTTASAALQFVEQARVSHTLTPTSDKLDTTLTDGTLLANGAVGAGGTPGILVIRWTPDFTGQTVHNNSVNVADVVGDNGGKITIYFPTDNWEIIQSIDGQIWYGPRNPLARTAEYEVEARGDQTVIPGGYTISMDAGIWTE